MTPSLDEVSTEYGALAEAVSHPDDFSFVTYRLRPEARWHDGKPVTPDDVIFSLEMPSRSITPMYSAYYRHVVKAEKIGERDMKFTFDAPGNRELPQIVGRADGAAEALVGRHRQRKAASATSPRPRWSRRWAPALTASRNSWPDVRSALERVKDYWGRDLADSMSAATISTRCATSISAMPPGRDRSVQGRSGRLAHRESARRTGRQPTISRP